MGSGIEHSSKASMSTENASKVVGPAADVRKLFLPAQPNVNVEELDEHQAHCTIL